MKKLMLFISLLSYLHHTSTAQDTSSLERKPYTLKVAVDKKNFYEQQLSAGAFVHPDNTVQLFPGETVYLEAKVDNGAISRLRAVPAILDSSRTITLSFMQTTKNKAHEMMMLKVTNPFSTQLSYSAMIFLFETKNWVPTSTIPVHPGLVGYETWPDLIISVALGKWTLETR